MVNTVSAVSLPPLVADRAVTETPARDMTSDSTSIIPDRIINRMNGWANRVPSALDGVQYSVHAGFFFIPRSSNSYIFTHLLPSYVWQASSAEGSFPCV